MAICLEYVHPLKLRSFVDATQEGLLANIDVFDELGTEEDDTPSGIGINTNVSEWLRVSATFIDAAQAQGDPVVVPLANAIYTAWARLPPLHHPHTPPDHIRLNMYQQHLAGLLLAKRHLLPAKPLSQRQFIGEVREIMRTWSTRMLDAALEKRINRLWLGFALLTRTSYRDTTVLDHAGYRGEKGGEYFADESFLHFGEAFFHDWLRVLAWAHRIGGRQCDVVALSKSDMADAGMWLYAAAENIAAIQRIAETVSASIFDEILPPGAMTIYMRGEKFAGPNAQAALATVMLDYANAVAKDTQKIAPIVGRKAGLNAGREAFGMVVRLTIHAAVVAFGASDGYPFVSLRLGEPDAPMLPPEPCVVQVCGAYYVLADGRASVTNDPLVAAVVWLRKAHPDSKLLRDMFILHEYHPWPTVEAVLPAYANVFFPNQEEFWA